MLDSPRAPRVREAARLQQRAARSSTGLFLLEGPAALDEAVRWQPQLLVDVFVTDAARERHAELIASAEQHAPVTAVSDRALAAIADTVHPQGVVAVAKQAPVRLEDAIVSAAAAEHPLVAILHEVRDPGNLGTILRAADAAGASAVIVTANEARGLDQATLALADRAARLPVYGHAESLNLATAASVCLYQSAFAQRAV